MILSVHQPQYLPWIGYFDKIRKSDAFVFLDNVQYKKREFQNRNRIRTPDGWQWLTVPVVTKDRFFQKIGDVAIDTSSDWRRDHWKSIEHNYRKAAFFSPYREILSDVYARQWERLADVNVHVTRLLLDIFKVSTPVYFERDFTITSTSTQRIVDLCKTLKADTYLSGAGGRDYMDEELFKTNGITLLYQEFSHPTYPQQFGGFEPYMSAIDYLLNCGPALFK